MTGNDNGGRIKSEILENNRQVSCMEKISLKRWVMIA